MDIAEKMDNHNLKEIYKFVSNCEKCGREFGHDANIKNKLCPICDPKELIKFKKVKPKDLNSTISNDLILGEHRNGYT